MKTKTLIGKGLVAGFIITIMFSGILAFTEETDNELMNRAVQTLVCLKNRDYKQLAKLVHKKKGVTFSPYAYINDDAVKLTAARIKTLKPTDIFFWGYYDGSGHDMNLSVEDYFARFVFDQDFTQAPQTGINELLKKGNTVSNLNRVFPGADFVEFHFPGIDPKYDGIDWTSLRLVFEKEGKQWMLVGIVHDCWTI